MPDAGSGRRPRSTRRRHPLSQAGAQPADRHDRRSVSRPKSDDKLRVRLILRRLAKRYPDAHCALDFRTPLELLVATILSAQCTDVRVNLVTPALFARYPTAQAFADADPRALDTLIQSTGFFRAKPKSIQASAPRVVEEFAGEVPQTLEELVQFPGIGRKTANVILGNCFGVPASPSIHMWGA